MSQRRTKTGLHERTKQAQETGRSNSVPPAAGVGLLDLQHDAGNRTVSEWLQSGPLIQTKSNNVGGATDAAERQADVAAETATQTRQGSARSLIVEDDARELQPGQMRKSEFLSALKASVCSSAEQSLRGTMWSTMGCPYIERWFERFENEPGARIERTLVKYAPDAATATSARDYIPIVTQRVSRGIGEWRETGQVTGLPEEFAAAGNMPGASVSGLLGSVMSGIGSAVSGLMSGIGSAFSGLASGIGGAFSSVGKMLFKRRDGETREADDPQAIREQLGAGHQLDSGTKGRLGSAFGADFADVRVHTDATAQGLSDQLNAHAFTIGNDIAFAPGEYQPGTVVGDALIAHELAHVVQQGGANSFQPQRKESDSELDTDADLSALGAMVSLAGGLTVPQTKPRRRSGLSLQRCGTSCDGGKQKTEKTKETAKPEKPKEVSPQPTPQQGKPEDWSFTPDDYAELTKGGQKLRISSDSAWFPAKLQENLLATLSYLLGPTTEPRGTEGINVTDLYHGHVVLSKTEYPDFPDLPEKVISSRAAFNAKEEAEKKKALGGESFNDVTEQNLQAFKAAQQSTLPLAQAHLEETVKVKGVSVLYHTFEKTQPSDLKAKGVVLKPGDPRRSYVTPLDTNQPAHYSPASLETADSSRDYWLIFQFAFLIDKNGEIHIRPGTTSDLSTVTGTPLK